MQLVLHFSGGEERRQGILTRVPLTLLHTAHLLSSPFYSFLAFPLLCPAPLSFPLVSRPSAPTAVPGISAGKARDADVRSEATRSRVQHSKDSASVFILLYLSIYLSIYLSRSLLWQWPNWRVPWLSLFRSRNVYIYISSRKSRSHASLLPSLPSLPYRPTYSTYGKIMHSSNRNTLCSVQ